MLSSLRSTSPAFFLLLAWNALAIAASFNSATALPIIRRFRRSCLCSRRHTTHIFVLYRMFSCHSPVSYACTSALCELNTNPLQPALRTSLHLPRTTPPPRPLAVINLYDRRPRRPAVIQIRNPRRPALGAADASMCPLLILHVAHDVHLLQPRTSPTVAAFMESRARNSYTSHTP